MSDITTFRSHFGLTANNPAFIVNGADPGDLGPDEDVEADLDMEWSGAVAPNATVKFVISASTASTDGVDLSAQYLVDNNLAAVMSTSFGQCEGLMGSAEDAFYSNLWAQAAAEGITAMVASGDNGAAGCEGNSGSSLGVNGLGSSSYNVCVGGTEFNDAAGSYWAASNGADQSSALGYIPETAWNESGLVSGGSGDWATVNFSGTATDSSASATLSYAWNFGDGTSATYAVILTVTDNTGVSASASRTVTVNPL